MGNENVIRVPWAEQPNSYVLIHVLSPEAESLDLEIEATEGENPYYARFKKSQLLRSQSSNSNTIAEDWELILRHIFLRERITELSKSVLGNLEVSASTSTDDLSIIFRKNISGITQRVGSVSIPRNEDRALDITSWTTIATTRSDSLEEEVISLQSKYQQQATIIDKLTAQLDDLVKAKQEHEDAMLVKFCEVLNEKKLKIRDQQRLLATAKIDPKKAAEVQASRTRASDAVPATSKSVRGKRKASKPISDSSEDSSEGGKFEEMPIRSRQGRRDSLEDQDTASETTADNDDNDDDREVLVAPSVSSSAKIGRVGGNAKAAGMEGGGITVSKDEGAMEVDEKGSDDDDDMDGNETTDEDDDEL
ncbi:hypothetical protein MMC25_000682 [Agyrium rufum]|nr:hypothetical protein [Agyrium rufum]